MAPPPVEEVRAHLEIGNVFFFVNSYRGPSTEPHNFVLLSPSPADETPLLFVSATSQVARKKHSRSDAKPGTLVEVAVGEFPTVPWITQATIFDCNEIDELYIVQLSGCLGRMQGEDAWRRAHVGNPLLCKLVDGVIGSPEVRRRIRRALEAWKRTVGI